MSHVDRWVRRHWRRLEAGRFLGVLAEWLAVYCCLWGVAILAAKLRWSELWPEVVWFGLGMIPLAVACWIMNRRDAFTPEQSAMMLDQRLQAGGLLMSLREVDRAGEDETDWQQRLPQLESLWEASLPRIWPARFIRVLALPLFFLSACFIIPPREALTQTMSASTLAQKETEELQKLVEALSEQNVVPEEEAGDLLEQITELAQQTQTGPLTHEQWEVLDTIRERLDLRVGEALLTNQQGLEAALNLAQLASGAAGNLDPQRVESMKGAVETALARVAADPALQEQLPAEARRLFETLAPDGRVQLPTDLLGQAAMLSELQQFLATQGTELGELQGMAAGLAERVSIFNQGAGSPFAANSSGAGSAGSNGWFGKEKESTSSRFRNIVLPRRDQSDLPGVDRPDRAGRAPEVATELEAQQRIEVREMEAASGRETWQRTLRPRHRQVIRDYFQSEAGAATSTGSENESNSENESK